MRKITQQAAAAFEAGRPLTIGNTSVRLMFDGSIILDLHGNAIAKRGPDGALYVTSAGWETNTTKDRLNGLRGVSVHQDKGQWYLNGEKWKDSAQWTKVDVNKQRLEELRRVLRAECISYGELIELQGLAEFIDPEDVELLEAAGVPEFPEEA
jgi:hypothetical protein